jgi:uncharacterized membrane protein YgdD (TMEM256/DUF423 family)
MTFAFLKASASVLGATGVMAGALGAHALHDTLVKRNMLRQYQTAVLYQVLHAAALVGVSCMMQDSSNKKIDESTPAVTCWILHGIRNYFVQW